MAGNRKKPDLLSKLQDLSEEAMQRLSDAPGADRVLSGVNTLKGTVDDLQKRVRGLEQLEKRLAALERKVDKLSKGGSASSASSSSSTARKTTSTKSSGASTTRKKS
jgi:prophage DNA circulation protein